MCSVLYAVCVLGVLVLPAASAGSLPTLVSKWSVPIPSGAHVALVERNIVIFSYQTAAGGMYNNTIQAVTANQTLWTLSALGRMQIPTTAYAFPAIPDVIYLAANNIQHPSISAVIPSTGAVVWSATSAFDVARGGNLIASVDGSTIYFSATSSGGANHLTAIDSATGEMLFAERQFPPLFASVQCGPVGDNCLMCASNSTVWLLHGRSGFPLGSVSLPTHAPVLEFAVAAQNLVLATTGIELFMVNTTNYTLAWSRRITTGTLYQLQTLSGGSPTNVALVLADTMGFSAMDAVTGGDLWNSSASTLCPYSDPIPGYAGSFENNQYRLGQLQPGEPTFLYTVVCLYGNSTLDVFGWINVTDGTVTRSRYLSWFPGAAPTSIGSSYFMLLYNDLRSNQTSEYFLTSHPWVFEVYPPWSFGCTPSNFILPVVRGSEVIFTVTCDVSLVTAMTIAE